MRIRHLPPLEHPLHKPLQSPLLHGRQHLMHQRIPQHALIRQIPSAQTAALEAHTFAQERGDIRAGGKGGAAQESEKRDAPVRRDGLEVRREITGADEIDNDIDARAARRRLDLARPLLRAVVVARRRA